MEDTKVKIAECSPYVLADLAVSALIEEVELTPKPGLVDLENNGAHKDLTPAVMRRSANALRHAFFEIAKVSHKRTPSQELREQIGAIGREGEMAMLEATKGVNTHRGALWALGLLVAASAMCKPGLSLKEVANIAGEISRYPDRYSQVKQSNGLRVQQKFGALGARGEANLGFPHVIKIALPKLYYCRSLGIPERFARLNALLAVMANLDDTCVLHRGGQKALIVVKEGANQVLLQGGASTAKGYASLKKLDANLLVLNASPGGSADLLSAALFLDGLSEVFTTNFLLPEETNV